MAKGETMGGQLRKCEYGHDEGRGRAYEVYMERDLVTKILLGLY